MYPVQLIPVPELRDRIVSFLGPRDVISLTETCHWALEDVEAYSRNELDRIEREHNVDGTWRFRVGRQAAQDKAALLNLWEQQQDENERPYVVPSDVSYRRLLRAAYRTHLYSLVDTTLVGHTGLSMHPNGAQLLSGGNLDPLEDDPGIVQLWDLNEKKCIRTYPEHGEQETIMAVRNVDFSAGHLVSSSMSEETLRIWSMDGVSQRALDLPVQSIRAQAVANDTVYAVDVSGPIYLINSILGTFTTMPEQPWGDTSEDVVRLCVCNNSLLHLRGGYMDRIESQGIFVFDRDSRVLQSYLPGKYDAMACSNNGRVALTRSSHFIQIFHLQGGNLVALFAVPDSSYDPYFDCSVLHMTESKIFVAQSTAVFEDSKITVYNATNGMKERSLSYPEVDGATNAEYVPEAMATNDREVFVGFGFWGGEKAGNTIKAFLL